ncbi:MAG: hypothetical protein JKY96_03185, partial [Phycisphaerales bacterium]|nr:hypothetical protein [Phycisphaerales bacterium]
MLDKLLEGQRENLMKIVMSKLGVSGDQAGGFLTKLFPMIQGLLGILSDPITGAESLPGVIRTLFRPDNLVEIAAREPALAARFTNATGRPFGQLGT